MKIELQTIHNGYDRKTCWVHARPSMVPGDHPIAIVTMQRMQIEGSDSFYEWSDMRSDDGGVTWSKPTSHPDTLGRRLLDNGLEETVSDLTPMWHAYSGTLLAIGHSNIYRSTDSHPLPHPRPRSTAYTTYDVELQTWSAWRKMNTPDGPKFFCEGAGSTQRLDLPNGEILLPTYLGLAGTGKGIINIQCVSTVMRCTFDGQTLRYVEHGTELTRTDGRGYGEPSIACVCGRYFLTLRNNDAGYITTSPDGLHYDAPKPWTFDDGSDLGNYNTQQHWITHGDNLYLIYTRRGADNDHVFRHRAPLFIAKVDMDRLCVIRDTEKILVPQRGARLGNFGVVQISDNEFWVSVSEWMQTQEPNHQDFKICEQYGSDNSVFVAKIVFDE